MATPVFPVPEPMTHKPHRTTPDPPIHPNPIKPRPIRKTHPKKPPQRGMGVAQLERLRLQERWKCLNSDLSLMNPSPSPYPYVYTGYPAGQVRAAELPSMPKTEAPHSLPPPFLGSPAAFSFPKKKRVNGEHEMGFMNSFPAACNDSPMLCGFPSYSAHQGPVEVVAVHRKGENNNNDNSNRAHQTVVKEYGFFPTGAVKKGNNYMNENERHYHDNTNSSNSRSSSSASIITSADASPPSLDLSLKLSYY